MNSRSMRTTGLVAIALSLVLAMYSLSLAGKARQAIDAAATVATKNEELHAQIQSLLNSQSKEARELKYLLDRLTEAEIEKARRAGRQPWRERID